MGNHLTIGQTAKRLGLEVDTVRKLEREGKIRAVRTRGGHRRFTEEEVDRYRKSRRKTATAKAGSRRRPSPGRRARPTRIAPNRHPRTGEFAAQDACFPDDLDDIDEALPNDEFDEEVRDGIYSAPPPAPPAPRVVQPPPAPAPRPSLFEARPAPVAPAATALSGFLDQMRLQRIKGYGRSAMPYGLPAEWQGRVIAELERFVTLIQFPSDLSDAKAAEIVRARVDEVLRPWRESEEKAARQKKAKEEADRRRAALIAHGNDYARRETSDWDWSASHEARDEVKKVLEREVEHDWTEREVEDEVDEVLDEWDDDEDDEGEDKWDDEDG
ncbi:MAG: excisionase family DNA-binding protein [Gemmatimonadales bacterium]|nr:excisionase family DNA-binding protein [Gemmatimonadales bacterium]MBP9198778.1 excisionase family DNA-binding protein [Gemmatimonadales bacterium]